MSSKTIPPRKGIEPEWSLRDLVGVHLAEAQDQIMEKLEAEYAVDSSQVYRVGAFLDQSFHQAASVIAEGITAAAFSREQEETPWA